jgi:hypothetical protein
MAEAVMYNVNGAQVSIGTTTLVNGFKKLRTAFSTIYGVTASPKAGINAPDVPIKVDWVKVTGGAWWVYFTCGDFDCEVCYTIHGLD